MTPGLMGWLQHLRGPRPAFPETWEDILASDFPPYHRLSAGDLTTLRDRIQAFLARTAVEGCHGQDITDQIRVNIAAYACLLILRLPGQSYHSLGSVLVYPTSFAAPVCDTNHHGIVTETLEERFGESWPTGTVVLSMDSLTKTGVEGGSGLNIILHEFAHFLDSQMGGISEAPLRENHQGCRDWADLWRREYTRARQNRRLGRPLVLDPYGAISPGEGFAVASETFFERPVRLKAHHPELYAELRAIYGQDPAVWRS